MAPYLGDLFDNETVHFQWNTVDTSGGSATRTTDGEVRVYKDNDVAQSTVGVTDTEDFDGLTGLHACTIDLSADAFYATGSNYTVVIQGAIVDSQTLNKAIGHFSIENRFNGRSSSGTAAINTTATSDSLLTTGTQDTGTYESTIQEDGSYHIIIPDGEDDTEYYYEFNVGGNGVPVSVTWTGYAQSKTDSYALTAYNWAGTSWDQVGTIDGSSLTTPSTISYALTDAHVGTGTDIGKVRFRFVSDDGTTFATDRILCSYSVVAQSVGYANGAVWVDTNKDPANENTTPYVDGVADNPVSTWTAAKAVATAMGLAKFEIANGSTITLDGASDNFTLCGAEWVLELGGQSCDDAAFTGAHVSGTCTGGEVIFKDCDLGDMTVAGLEGHSCALTGDITLSAANTYYFDNCYSGVAGTATPSIDFGAGVANTNLNLRHYSGGIEIKNIGANGVDNMSLEGHGQLVLASTCAGGTIAIRGHFTITDNVGGGFAGTLSQDARFDKSEVFAEMTAGAPPATPTIQEVLMYWYMWLRNDTQGSATLRKILDDAGATIAEADVSVVSEVTHQGKLGAP